LTGNIYSELLENIIDPTLTNIIKNEHYFEDQLVFQQNGTLPHYAQHMRNIWIKFFQVVGLKGEALLNGFFGL